MIGADMYDQQPKKYEWHQLSYIAYQCLDMDGNEVAALYKDLSDPISPMDYWKAVLCSHPYGHITLNQIFSDPESAAKTVESVLEGGHEKLHLSLKPNYTATRGT
jgi:hypothetical protein